VDWDGGQKRKKGGGGVNGHSRRRQRGGSAVGRFLNSWEPVAKGSPVKKKRDSTKKHEVTTRNNKKEATRTQGVDDRHEREKVKEEGRHVSQEGRERKPVKYYKGAEQGKRISVGVNERGRRKYGTERTLAKITERTPKEGKAG